LYIVSLAFISFDSQVRFILRFKRKSRRATSASKTTINKREAKSNAREAKETKVEAKRTKVDTKANAKANARVTTIATTTTTTTNKKQLSKLRRQFVYTYINLVLETILMLLSCLLLFNNSQEYINNTLYSQKLIKFLNQFRDYSCCNQN